MKLSTYQQALLQATKKETKNMTKQVSIHTHKFEKQNLVTKFDDNMPYDNYRCTNCGLKGRRYGFSEWITVDGRTSTKRLNNCPEAAVPTKIKVTRCHGHNPAFGNMTPNSEHDVVEPPEEHREKFPNNNASVWVMGVGEPVRLLAQEFTVIE